MQHAVQLAQTGAVQRTADQSVLHNGILHSGFAQFVTELRVLRHCDALVIHQNAAGGVLQGVDQPGHDGLLLTQNLCVRHIGNSPPEIFMARRQNRVGRFALPGKQKCRFRVQVTKTA